MFDRRYRGLLRLSSGSGRLGRSGHHKWTSERLSRRGRTWRTRPTSVSPVSSPVGWLRDRRDLATPATRASAQVKCRGDVRLSREEYLKVALGPHLDSRT